ncbi:hypothetical protein C2G38_2248429 [Gigaspora rosea]|uniref:Uncharacterized protein n=1 Tax=Gigaspora rosea TaxID=44941 RepID=A0A397UWJ4_9GLOM|nr:hypothetical protein C2G38_2248429 [Gigaspora rosea]
MYSIPHCEDEATVFNIFNQLSDLDEEKIQAGNNTNASEAAHAYANRSGKQLKLLSAINRGRKLDETTVSRMQIHMKFNVPVTHRDNGEIKRKAVAMTRKSAATTHKKNKLQAKKNLSKKSKSKIITISDSETEATSSKKPKIKSESNDLHELEIEERKIMIKERAVAIREKEIDIRKKEAEIEALELANKKMRNDLEHAKQT